MGYFSKLVFFRLKTECMVIVTTITNPPIIVSVLGCSFITNHTQRGPNIVSSKKKILTSAALMYLGAKVIKTKGIVLPTLDYLQTKGQLMLPLICLSLLREPG